MSMHRVFSLTFLAALAAAGLSAGRGAAAGEPEIALLDVAYIFKNHPGYLAMKDDLQTAVDLAETEVKRERDKLRSSTEQLAKLSAESPEYRQLEEQLTRQQADLNVRIHTQRKRFVEQEAKMLLTVYEDILRETQHFCKQHGIRVVLRFNGESTAPDNPEQVVALVNRPVVYHDPAIDITQIILQQIVQKQGGTNTAARPGTARPAAGLRPQGGPQGKPR